MLSLARALTADHEIRGLLQALEGGRFPAVISGLSGIHRSHVTAAVAAETGRPVLVVCVDDAEAKRQASDIGALLQLNIPVLSEREFVFYNAEGVSREYEQRRIAALLNFCNAPVTVATVAGLMQRTISRQALERCAITLRTGESYDISDIASKLVLDGYTLCDQVEGYGQFARRGGILDFFSPNYPEPVRCEFFGDEIDSMSFFSSSTQRRTERLEQADIVPVAETLPSLYEGSKGSGVTGLLLELREQCLKFSKRKNPNEKLIESITSDIERIEAGRVFPAADRYIEFIYPMATGADYIPADAVIIMHEPSRVKEKAKNYTMFLADQTTALLESGVLESSFARFSEDFEGLLTKTENYPFIMADSFLTGSYPRSPRALFNLTAKNLPSYGGSIETAVGDILHYTGANMRTVVLARDERRCKSLEESLRERGVKTLLDFELSELPPPGSCTIALGALSAGVEYSGLKLAVITEGQISKGAERQKSHRGKKLPSNRERLQSFTDLAPGDLVVHESHGIGRYVGIFKIAADKVEKDYIKIAYAGGDSLYVPAMQLNLVSKYIGAGEDAPIKLSKMGGGDWERAKGKAKAAARDMAKGLIALYAERRRLTGHAFSQDSIWQREFEDAFEYQETDDQLKCVEEIKADMEKHEPMDRLLCGDVGYGKTEVALRAVMKCVLDGYQTAILVPTTVLAQQHYTTAMRRFAGYPVNISVLSRFTPSSRVKKDLREIEAGGIDLVIGTHKLLTKNLIFKKLGLLIVDEEQRFGVTHKERLKEISRRVDVLTLSATPIPRTLSMALSGIRDMSTIEEPPQDRQPVQTYVMEHDYSVIADAISREISRGGQVYYIHNRIESIARCAARLHELLPDNTIEIAHGRLEEDALGDVMERMTQGEIQVLVCTTIIETGIDIPNVNTLIIEDADRLGLAQLHQIRGRVGRSPRRAYAYLTFRQGKVLTEVAEKRLSAIREFAEFNSGFKIAMRDLEIRGAGNLLGAEQSGHMVSVGYDMYLKLLEEAVLEERGEKKKLRPDCPAEFAVDALIPESYVASGEQRMDIYRRVARIESDEDASEMIAELIDRYGDPPAEAVALITIAQLRAEAAVAGVTEIVQKEGSMKLTLSDFDMAAISKLYAKSEYTGRVKVEAGTAPAISLKFKTQHVLTEALAFIRDYAKTQTA